MTAAVGVAIHSAWVMAVTVSGSVAAPIVVDRRRIELVGEGLPDQAYHASVESGMSQAEASALLDAWAKAARGSAGRGLEKVASVALAAGHAVSRCGICAVPKALPPLEAVLRSHPLLHAAEGQLALTAVAEAAADLGLAVTHIAPEHLTERVRAAATELRRAAGPPWAADQKKAAGAALTALAARDAR